MAITKPAEPQDADAIAELLDELDRFYGATETEPRALRIEQIRRALFENPPSAYALLAWEGDKLVGFAAYSFLWPAAGVTRSLYLKELYVVEEFRRSGIGQLLMQSIFDTAARNECSRVEWATDTFNADAQRFYERLGFKTLSTKVDYRVEGEQLLQATQAVSGASS